MDIYLHGIETIEKNDGPRSVQTIDTGIIGLIGTAPAAVSALWPLNTPIPIFGIGDAATGLGKTGTVPAALESIFKQATRASQTVVVVLVAPGSNVNELMANIIGSVVNKTGMQAFRKAFGLLGLKPKILIAPGVTGLRPADGLESISISETGNVGYVTAPLVTITGGGGQGATAVATIDANGKVDAITLVTRGFGYTSVPTIGLSGGTPTTPATATGVLGTVANPVVANLLAVANALRATVPVDGPNTTAEGAVAYRNDFDNDRLYIIDPMAKTYVGDAVATVPAAPFVAGLMARVDYEEGFWVSASNHVLEGVIGAGRPVEHSLSDPSAESQYLNKNGVATIVRSPSGGFKLWGARAASSDPLKKFLSVRRSHDTIIESIEIAHEPFIDKPFSLQMLTDIAETVNAALRRWQALGATLGGRVWFDGALNTKESWSAGHLYVSYDAEGPAPIEHITFLFSRNTGYYEKLGQDAIREISRLASVAA